MNNVADMMCAVIWTAVSLGFLLSNHVEWSLLAIIVATLWQTRS